MVRISSTDEPDRNLRQERRLWHDAECFPMALGCVGCRHLNLCGGLHIERSAFDCLSLCCNHPDDCDAVCPNNPDMFATRVREIGGFALDNIPRAPILPAPPLPPLVPVIYHGNKRSEPFNGARMACLPLYKVITGNGTSRYKNAADLARRFKIAWTTSVILTGTAVDPPLEKWWSLGPTQRRDAIQSLRDLNIALVTTPNYSLFTDQPRWDDMHSVKRIGLVHEEFLQGGLVAALHVNARTERDWERWGDYILPRPEVTHIAYEFATGAGWAGRLDWHVAQLVKLAHHVNRPLHLIVRGGGRGLPALAAAYSQMTCLETSTFVKSVRRQRAVLMPKGGLRWRRSPTDAAEPVDALLAANWAVADQSYARLLNRSAWRPQAA